jgi:dTDP-4-amino-4,6-dideoxygalactose transaminase
LADRLLRLPFFTDMSSSEQAQIIDAARISLQGKMTRNLVIG